MIFNLLKFIYLNSHPYNSKTIGNEIIENENVDLKDRYVIITVYISLHLYNK